MGLLVWIFKDFFPGEKGTSKSEISALQCGVFDTMVSWKRLYLWCSNMKRCIVCFYVCVYRAYDTYGILDEMCVMCCVGSIGQVLPSPYQTWQLQLVCLLIMCNSPSCPSFVPTHAYYHVSIDVI